MSDSPSNKRAPGFVWLLGVFAGFAVLGSVLSKVFTNERPDPRAAERSANLAEISKAQNDNLAKMGLEKGKSAERLAASLEVLKKQAPTKSNMVVPGSPTQLKQAATSPPAAAPAAPAPAK